MKYEKKYNRDKGIVLIIILMVVAAIVIVGLGFIVRGDTELLTGQNTDMAADMSYLAESGLEHARGLIMYPQDVNIDGWSATSQQLVSGSSDYYDVRVTKSSELNWQITSSAYRQISGSRTAQNSMTANLRLDPAIGFWSATSVLLYPDANITGDVYGVSPGSGLINGDRFIVSPVNEPNINYSLLTSNFTTQTISGSSLNNQVLPSSSSTQVCCKSSSLTIGSGVTINGCLAVNGNLTISGISNVINAQKNVPALYVSGNLIINQDAALDCNGLVFVNGQINLSPFYSTSAKILNITGSLFTNGGIVYGNIVPDISGKGYNGTINGNCTVASGKFGDAINFDGNGDFINVGTILAPALITVTAYIKVNSFDKDSQTIIAKGGYSWRLRRYGSTNNIEFCISSDDKIQSSGINVNDGQWHHIAGVYDGDWIYLYIDGTQFKQGASDIITPSIWPVYIGGSYDYSDRWFDGLIDDVRVYNTALSQSDIQTIRAGGMPSAGSSHFLGYWPMDCGTTTIKAAPTKAAIYDWSGTGGTKNRWSPAAGAFYKSIARNP
ncbi:MAG: LamG domain-containing protein [Sedimentisphaerales bacterium]